jgi:hypothetical protein
MYIFFIQGNFICKNNIQLNLNRTTTLGTLKNWSLFIGGCSLEVLLKKKLELILVGWDSVRLLLADGRCFGGSC